MRTTLKACLKVTKAIPTGRDIQSGAFSSIIELNIVPTEEKVAGKVFKVEASDTERLMPKVDEIKDTVEVITKFDHFNIVQCKGITFLPDRIMPVLLMEIIMESIQSYIKNKHHLSLVHKITILQGTANGLNYLHTFNPMFIHGHLTAENVLLDVSRLRVKIAGFNLDPTPQISDPMEYVPPEATKIPSDPSFDVFSFGHLALVTLLQEEVKPLLPSQYFKDNEPAVRHEVERRKIFIDKAKQLLGDNGLFGMIKKCLENVPSKRPTTEKVIKTLQETSELLLLNILF